MHLISNSVQDTHRIAQQLLSSLKTNLICLYGDLGSGKTTFVQGLAKALGIKKHIISPTFIIMKEYSIHHPLSMIYYSSLIHIDCYRLHSALNAKSFNFQELWSDKNNLVVIEWAEKIKNILPKKRIDIKFSYIDNNKRKITIDG